MEERQRSEAGILGIEEGEDRHGPTVLFNIELTILKKKTNILKITKCVRIFSEIVVTGASVHTWREVTSFTICRLEESQSMGLLEFMLLQVTGNGFMHYQVWEGMWFYQLLPVTEKLKYNRWKLMHNFCVLFIIWKPAVERETWSTQAHESVCVNTTQGDQKSHQQFIVVPFCILFSSCVALLGRLGIWYPWPLLPF